MTIKRILFTFCVLACAWFVATHALYMGGVNDVFPMGPLMQLKRDSPGSLKFSGAISSFPAFKSYPTTLRTADDSRDAAVTIFSEDHRLMLKWEGSRLTYFNGFSAEDVLRRLVEIQLSTAQYQKDTHLPYENTPTISARSGPLR